MRQSYRIIALPGLSGILMAQSTPSGEAQHLATSSQEFVRTREVTVAKLREDGFTKLLLAGGLGAASSDQAKASSVRVKSGAKLTGVSIGAINANYDLIIQPGHYGRTKGATGASGTLVSEQQIVAYIVGSVASRLRASGYNVLVVPADNVAARTAKIFLAVHAEGSVSQCSAGPSLAYKTGTTPFAMHAIGLGISQAVGYDYKNFRADNYTKNEAEYYMYKRIDADRLNGLLEIGEITCASAEQKMLVNVDRMSTNLTYALEYILKLK